MDKPRIVAYTMLIAASIATMVMGGSHRNTSASPANREPVRVVRIGGDVGGYSPTSSVPAPFTTYSSAFAAATLPGPVAYAADPTIERVAKGATLSQTTVRASSSGSTATSPAQSTSPAPAVPAAPASLSDITNAVTSTTTTTTGTISSTVNTVSSLLPVPLPSPTPITNLLP